MRLLNVQWRLYTQTLQLDVRTLYGNEEWLKEGLSAIISPQLMAIQNSMKYSNLLSMTRSYT